MIGANKNTGSEIMQNMIFKCDRQEKNLFMVNAEKAGLGASMVLRNLVHLYLTDSEIRRKALTFGKGKEENETV